MGSCYPVPVSGQFPVCLIAQTHIRNMVGVHRKAWVRGYTHKRRTERAASTEDYRNGWSVHKDLKEHRHHASEGDSSYSNIAAANNGFTGADY